MSRTQRTLRLSWAGSAAIVMLSAYGLPPELGAPGFALELIAITGGAILVSCGFRLPLSQPVVASGVLTLIFAFFAQGPFARAALATSAIPNDPRYSWHSGVLGLPIFPSYVSPATATCLSMIALHFVVVLSVRLRAEQLPEFKPDLPGGVERSCAKDVGVHTE